MQLLLFTSLLTLAHAVTVTNNYAGAVIRASDDFFNRVSGNFTVPAVEVPTGAAQDGTTYRIAAWVGLDGSAPKDRQAILQAGCGFLIAANEGATQTNRCWHQWFDASAPAGAEFLTDFHPSIGDMVNIVCALGNRNENGTTLTGQCTLTNVNTGQTETVNMTPPTANAYVYGGSAEWVVEDPVANGALAPLAKFDTVQFQDCIAYSDTPGAANEYDLSFSGVDTFELRHNGVQTAIGEIQNALDLLVEYTGN